MKRSRSFAIDVLAAVLGACVLCGAARAAVTASADRTQLAPGDTVELTLQSDRGGGGQPDLAPLEKDFEILGRRTSNRLQIINGSASTQRQVTLTLSPRRQGRVEVPRLAWDGEQSAAIELSVAANRGNAGGGAAAGSVADVFFTTTLDSLQPHVQSALNVQLRLYSDKKLYQASVEFAGNTDALLRRIGQDVTTQETRNGRAYQVITRHYLLVPQRSGEIRLDGPVLTAQVADGSSKLDPFMAQLFGQLQVEGGASGTRSLRLRGDPVTLRARARPPGLQSGDWLPAQQLTIEADWEPAGGVIAVDAPVTRRLRLSAVGLSASQLPDLSTQLIVPPGLKAHPDEARLEDEVHNGHIVGRRDQDIVLLADRAGRFELPALRVGWWDVVTNQRRETVVPALALEVAAGAGALPMPGNATASSPVSDAAAMSAPWQPAAASSTASADRPGTVGAAPLWTSISLALGLLWLATLGVWAWTHRRRQRAAGTAPATRATQVSAVSAAAARREFQQACREHAARRARDALLAWARATWPDAAPAGLNALARRLGQAEITPLLRDLERACLDGTAWNGDALAGTRPALGKADRARQPQQDLPGLYSEQEA